MSKGTTGGLSIQNIRTEICRTSMSDIQDKDKIDQVLGPVDETFSC